MSFRKPTQSHGQSSAPQTFRPRRACDRGRGRWRVDVRDVAWSCKRFSGEKRIENSSRDVAGRRLLRRNVAADWRTTKRYRPRRRRLLRDGDWETGDGRSAKRRPYVHGAVEPVARPTKNGNRRHPERGQEHRRACPNRTPIYGQLPAAFANIFPAISLRRTRVATGRGTKLAVY